MASSSADVEVLYKMQGSNVSSVFMAREANIIALTKKIKAENPRKLGNVDANDINVYQSEQQFLDGEALEAMDLIPEQTAKDAKGRITPFYIQYDQQSTGSAPAAGSTDEQQAMQLARLEKKIDFMMNAQSVVLRATHGFRPGSSKSTVDPTWEDRLRTYYGTSCCMILGQIYPECLADLGSEYGFGPDYFHAVGEHVYKKSMQREGQDLGIDTRHPRNGLLLLKHMELMFHDGHVSLIPVGLEDRAQDDDPDEPQQKVTFEVKVATDICGEVIHWKANNQPDIPMCRPLRNERTGGSKGKTDEKQKRIQKGKTMVTQIKFGDLDGQKITIRKPYMASLYMQLQYASHIHAEFPAPSSPHLLPMYNEICQLRMQRIMELFHAGVLSQGPAHQLVEQADAFEGGT